MKFNKVYLQRDALARHEDFDTWYEDGDLFYRFVNKKGWTAEKQNISIIGRMGGENAAIRPDNRCLNYYLRFERYEYIMHPYVINKHYYIEGMLWDLYGSFSNPPFDFVTETKTSYTKKDVHVKTRLFRDKGECFEIHVPDLTKLRVAVIAMVAIGLKEEWKGLSEGEDVRGNTWVERLKNRVFENKGLTYEQIQALEREGSPLVEVVKPQGRPMDNV
ncbi:MAG: hypothetical protein HFJ65_06900 [Eggerthellaceae bacterium]|nr:hypothetical protein [Eggerthellaceae bacterium]